VTDCNNARWKFEIISSVLKFNWLNHGTVIRKLNIFSALYSFRAYSFYCDPWHSNVLYATNGVKVCMCFFYGSQDNRRLFSNTTLTDRFLLSLTESVLTAWYRLNS